MYWQSVPGPVQVAPLFVAVPNDSLHDPAFDHPVQTYRHWRRVDPLVSQVHEFGFGFGIDQPVHELPRFVDVRVCNSPDMDCRSLVLVCDVMVMTCCCSELVLA